MDDEIRVTIIATGFEDKKGANATPVSGIQSALGLGGSSKDKFDTLLSQTQAAEEKKSDEKDPFEDILRIFDR